MKRCVNCNLPETHETITFDSGGVCNICNQNLFKKENIDWDQQEKLESKTQLCESEPK